MSGCWARDRGRKACSSCKVQTAEETRQKGHPELVVQIAPCFVDLSKETGGVANIVRQICLKLSGLGVETLLVCGNTELGTPVAEPRSFQADTHLRQEVIFQHGHPLMGPTRRLRRILTALPSNAVMHVHTCFSMLTESAMAWALSNRVPYIFTPHGKLSPDMLRKQGLAKRVWWSLVARRPVRSASAICLSSKAEAGTFGRLGLPLNFGVVPNGFEKDRSGSTPVVPIPAKPYILFLGYLDPRKQPDLLLRAFAQSRVRSTHMLVLAGPDAYGFRSELEREVDRAGVGEHTLFIGPVYGASKWALLENACCLCLPSKAEGFPLVLAEALGAGVPSVYSRQCNFPEAASAGAGLEIADFTTESWLQAIEVVCLDSDLNHKMRLAAQALAPRYSWSRIAQEWLSVYRGLSQSL